MIAFALAAVLLAAPVWSSDARHAQWHPPGDQSRWIRQNEWNWQPGTHQLLRVWRWRHWQVIARAPGGNTAVLTYPDAQKIYTQPSGWPLPLRRIGSLVAHYAISQPARGWRGEPAFDIWENDYSTEIMLWVGNHDQTPAGHPVRRVWLSGASWRLWVDRGDRIFSLVRHPGRLAGTVRLRQILGWLARHGYGPAHPGLSAAEFGWEICSTGGHDRTFTVRDYRLRLHRR